MKKNKQQKTRDLLRLRDHLANEQTFLAWLRTSIGIIVVGFIVNQFSLFLNQMLSYLDKWSIFKAKEPTQQDYSAEFGILFISLGALLSILAFIKYKIVEKQIEQNTYSSMLLLDMMLILSVCLITIFAIIILI
jgi:putative membrane protein